MMTDQSQDHVTVPGVFPEILKDLNREVIRTQPEDVYQFCADYFFRKLSEQRVKLLNMEYWRTRQKKKQRNSLVTPLSPSPTKTSSASFPKTPKKPPWTQTSPPPTQPTPPSPPIPTPTDSDDDATVPLPPVTYNRGRRTSVSAESMAPTTDKDYIKIIIPKSDTQKSRIQASIQNNFLFRSCDEEQYTDVVNAMSEKQVVKGEEVITQGGVGDYFYVVETGLWMYTFPVITLHLNGNTPTVTATQDSVLWALDRVTFRRILMENTSRKRRMYEAFLEEVPLLISLEAYERHKIADALESVVYGDGDVVIRQGEAGDNFYIVEAGEATVTTLGMDGVEHEEKRVYQKGDYFGELALLTNEPRRATVRAKGRLKVATLGKKAFVRLLGPVVDILKRNANNYDTFADKIQTD
ncbi:cyclic nucleotide-binding-like protein [Chytridium lagenaria]|nr:cyclic nucleotide-binding-like protein [Chytridium lagenaria]